MDSVSGVVDVPGETVVLMDGCTHFDICRFENDASGIYKRISFHIEKLANGKFKPFPFSFNFIRLFNVCFRSSFLICRFLEHCLFFFFNYSLKSGLLTLMPIVISTPSPRPPLSQEEKSKQAVEYI